MGAIILVDDMNLLARLHMRRAILQSPRQREATFSVEDVDGLLSRIGQAQAYDLVFGEPQEIEDLVSTATDLCYRRLGMTFISGDALTEWLRPLEERLSKFLLVGFFLSRSNSERNALRERFLEVLPIPGLCVFETSERDQWHVVDPTPPVLVASRELDAWPGIVLWSPTGHCALIPMSELLEVLNELREVGDAARHQPVEKRRLCDAVLVARGGSRGSPKLLQLSDLHFGTEEAATNQVYLLNHLDRVVEEVGRVLITGDLMDIPNSDNLNQVDAFVSRIASRSKKDNNPIIIPGNHDERKTWGSLWQSLKQVVQLDHQAVAVDHRLRCVFLGFDSTLDSSLAEGFVSEEQTKRVAAQLEMEISRSPEVKDYLQVALVHHHPLQLKEEDEGFREHFAEYSKEMVVGMREGERFLKWCAKREARLVLHGHKHRPRRRDAWVSIGPGELRKVMVVGCGTSLGVRGRPLGYNLITWDVTGKAWSVEFWESERDGSGFFPSTSAFSQEPWAM